MGTAKLRYCRIIHSSTQVPQHQFWGRSGSGKVVIHQPKSSVNIGESSGCHQMSKRRSLREHVRKKKKTSEVVFFSEWRRTGALKKFSSFLQSQPATAQVEDFTDGFILWTNSYAASTNLPPDSYTSVSCSVLPKSILEMHSHTWKAA